MNPVGGLESAAPVPARAPRVAGFDGLRAVAALSVLVFHAATTTGRTTSGWAAEYLGHLDVGVSLFFVLSGYLLYRPIAVAHFKGGPGPGLGRYARRRALRILPAYWVALAITAFVLGKATINSVGDAAVFFGLAQIYSGRHAFGGLVQAWSLCTEVAFYALLPLYGGLLGRRAVGTERQLRREMTGLAVLVAVSVAFRLELVWRNAALGYPWLPSYLDVFALGMGLAVLSARATTGGRPGLVARTLGGAPLIVWSAALVLFVALSNLGIPQGLVPITTAQYFTRQTLGGLIAALVVGAVAFAPDGGWSGQRLLGSLPLRALGLVSYGIFLWHLTWIQVVIDSSNHRYAASFPVVLWVTVALSLAAAATSYFLIERPALSLGESGMQTRAAMATARGTVNR